VGQLLWAAQGITDPAEGLRTAPSAGALYPLETYVATAAGFFHYQPREHRLRRLFQDDPRPRMFQAACQQDVVTAAPAIFVLAAVYARTEAKYGRDSRLYVPLDLGHAAENLLLQAVALGLGGVPIGALETDRMRTALALPCDHRPEYLVAVGHPL
jgi:SagB-type dehydrogenase family enzyme